MTLDDAEFTKAFRQYAELSSKTMTESINKVAIDLCFKAAAQMPSGDPSREHPKGAKIYHVLAAGGKRSKNGESLETKLGKAVKGKGNRILADKIFNRRRRSKGYSAVICRKIAGDLGARLSVRAGKIKYASGKRAVKSIKPFAVLDVKGLEKTHVDDVIQPAFERAMRIVTAKMVRRVNKKLAEAAKKHSGRKR